MQGSDGLQPKVRHSIIMVAAINGDVSDDVASTLTGQAASIHDSLAVSKDSPRPRRARYRNL